jgi:hypothetical protein
MDKSLQRKLVYGALSLALGLLATRISLYLTNMIVGHPEEAE